MTRVDWGANAGASDVPGTFHMGLYAFSGRNVGNQARGIGYIAPF